MFIHPVQVTFSDQGPTTKQVNLDQVHESEIASETISLPKEDSEKGATHDLVDQVG